MWITNPLDASKITFVVNETPKKDTTYYFNEATCPEPICSELINYASYEKEGNFYMTDTSFTGKITFIKADSVLNIWSANYEFNARNRVTGKLIKITQGRFDYDQKYRYSL